jgi:hypothetical protein
VIAGRLGGQPSPEVNMLMLPDDLATCALAGILMNYHTNAQKLVPHKPEWTRTPDQEVIRELSARMAAGVRG